MAQLSIFSCAICRVYTKGAELRITKLVAAFDGQTVTIEPNEVLRGAVFTPEQRPLVAKAETAFEMAVRMKVVSLNEPRVAAQDALVVTKRPSK